MKLHRKTKLVLVVIAGFFITVLIWYLRGMPYGYIPGRYDEKTGVYKVCFTNARLQHTGKLFRVAVKFPVYREGLIDATGRIIVPLKYDKIKYAPENSSLLDSFGVTDWSLPVQHAGINLSAKKCQCFILWKNGKAGMADNSGKLVVPCKYSKFYGCDEYVGFVEKQTPYGENYPEVFDTSGKKIPLGIYEHVVLTNSRIPFFIARKNNKEQYLIDKKTLKAQSTDFLINKIYRISDCCLLKFTGVYADSIKGKLPWADTATYYSNIHEDTIITPDKKYYYPKCGLLDNDGKVVLPPVYDYIGSVSQKLIVVMKFDGNRECETKSGIIDGKGVWLVPARYYRTYVSSLMPIIEVQKYEEADKRYKTFYVDFKGNIILSTKISVIEKVDRESEQYIIFERAGESYKLEYNKTLERFTWRKY